MADANWLRLAAEYETGQGTSSLPQLQNPTSPTYALSKLYEEAQYAASLFNTFADAAKQIRVFPLQSGQHTDQGFVMLYHGKQIQVNLFEKSNKNVLLISRSILDNYEIKKDVLFTATLEHDMFGDAGWLSPETNRQVMLNHEAVIKRIIIAFMSV